MTRIIRLGTVIAALIAVLAAPAPASFPGRNGDIVASSSIADGGALHRWLIFLTPAGTERRRVAVPSGVSTFSASPDGRRLAYDRWVKGREGEVIMVADLRLQHQRRVTTSNGGVGLVAGWALPGVRR